MINHTTTLFIVLMAITQSPLIHATKPMSVEPESKAVKKTSSTSESRTPEEKARIQSLQELQFDEADAMFGKRSTVKTTKTVHSNSGLNNEKQKHTHKSDHRKRGKKSTNNEQIIAPNNKNTVVHRKNSGIKKTPKRGTKGPAMTKVNAPTQVTLYDVTSNSLRISWMDNANNEYGVSVERGIPQEDRGGINYGWQHVFNVEERIDSNIKGTGWRTDGDDGLSPNIKYCYRLKAYHQKQFSRYSETVCLVTQ